VLDEHARRLFAHEAARDEGIKYMEEAVRAAVREIRGEMIGKLASLATRIEALENEVAQHKGETNVLAQQNRDTSRCVARYSGEM
jgi:hypothetical protein